MAASKGMSAREVYQMVNVHMKDSTEHNKGIFPLLAEVYDLGRYSETTPQHLGSPVG